MHKGRHAQLADALNARCATPCPRCGGATFSVVGEGYVPFFTIAAGLHDDRQSRRVITLIAACDSCGFLTAHDQARLGTLVVRRAQAGVETAAPVAAVPAVSER